jgi:hypothetical protein
MSFLPAQRRDTYSARIVTVRPASKKALRQAMPGKKPPTRLKMLNAPDNALVLPNTKGVKMWHEHTAHAGRVKSNRSKGVFQLEGLAAALLFFLFLSFLARQNRFS